MRSPALSSQQRSGELVPSVHPASGYWRCGRAPACQGRHDADGLAGDEYGLFEPPLITSVNWRMRQNVTGARNESSRLN
jgi:hypothetical protein